MPTNTTNSTTDAPTSVATTVTPSVVTTTDASTTVVTATTSTTSVVTTGVVTTAIPIPPIAFCKYLCNNEIYLFQFFFGTLINYSYIIADVLACGFENDWCNIIPAGEKYWKRISGRTNSFQTGPEHDRSAEGGKYMYFEATNLNEDDLSMLMTPYAVANGKNQCLEFFYHMHGNNMGILIVFNSNFDVLWSKTGNQGNEWQQALVNISGPAGSRYRVFIP